MQLNEQNNEQCIIQEDKMNVNYKSVEERKTTVYKF